MKLKLLIAAFTSTLLLFLGINALNTPQVIADTLRGEISESEENADEYRIVGTVLDSRNRPLVNIRVELQGPAGRFTRITNADGKFLLIIDEDDEGDYIIRVTKGEKITRFEIFLPTEEAEFEVSF